MADAAIHPVKAGLYDLLEGMRAWRIWHLMGSSEVRRRYARSRLGQFWLTLSTGIFVLLYGLVFSLLFRRPVSELMPYVAVSYVCWTFTASIINNATTCFVGSHPYFRNQYASFSIAVYSTIYRSLIALAHNALIVVIVLAYFGLLGKAHVFEFLLGLAIVVFSAVWMTYLIGIVCTRYRDLIQIVTSVMQAAFFLTPVFWEESMFPEDYRHWLLFNPFVTMLSLLRDPILGVSPRPIYWGIALIGSIVGFLVSLAIIGRYRRRIIFWM